MRHHLSGHAPIGLARPAAEAERQNSDEALVAKVAAGNRLAMQALFARHHTRVYRFVLRLIGNEALAEDVTSETFLCVWQQAERFAARSSFATWLLAIARNKALTELRHRRELPPDEEEEDETADAADDPEAAYAVKHRRAVVRACLARLSREQRVIIDLVYYHEKSVQEVAQIMDIPRNTVKTRMFYARRKLSQLLVRRGVAHAAL
jgi:RNA polymerase sigma-70 factor (ECF subfamily)